MTCRAYPSGMYARVNIQTDDDYSLILKYIKKHGSHVRSLIYRSGEPREEHEPFSMACGCKLLRILDTRANLGSSDVDEVLELLHLRYLSLVNIVVPSNIFHLQNLQTLILRSHASLPLEIWKMPQLKHVMSKTGVALPPIPYHQIRITDGVPLLGNLLTLSRVEGFKFTGDTIEMIPNLKKLGVRCEPDRSWEKYGLNILVHLDQLETLFIWFDISFDISSWCIPLPKNFAFPSTLIKLTLVRCKLPWKDMCAVGSLPNLQVLKLRVNAFLGEEWEPIEGQFLKLKFLKTDRLYDLKYWQAENSHFPYLEHLHITFCSALREIPPGFGDIPTLQLIKLELEPSFYRRSALESSALRIQEQQRDLGNDDLRVLVR